MTDIDYVARVAKGVALLDEKRPGWEREIDLSTLDIKSADCCVTAQLSGVSDWRAGMKRLDLDLDSYTSHGFRASDHEWASSETGDVYGTLNTLWRDAVTEKLAALPA